MVEQTTPVAQQASAAAKRVANPAKSKVDPKVANAKAEELAKIEALIVEQHAVFKGMEDALAAFAAAAKSGDRKRRAKTADAVGIAYKALCATGAKRARIVKA